MFGMGFFEILVVLVVAIIFLGPEKFPQAVVDVVKFFRAVKKTLNDAKDTLDKEINIEEIKKETLEYQKLFENKVESLKGVKIEELEDAKVTAENEIKSIQDLMQDYQKSLETNTTPNHLNEEVSNEEALNKEVSSDEPPKEVKLANNTKEHDKEKSMFEDLKPHLQELRKRLMVSVATILVAFLGCFHFWKNIFEFVKNSYKGTLIQLSPIEGVMVAVKISFSAAIVISMPIIFWQLWLFIAPGLYKNEKKVILPFVFFGSGMFLIGAAFSYYVVFPFIIEYLATFGSDMFAANISASSYVSFFTRLILGFGVAFELPVLAYFLAKVGLITDASLKAYFKYAIVVIFIVAAIITPPDVVSQIFMALPLVGLYGLSILIAKIVNPAPKDNENDSEKDSENNAKEHTKSE